PCGSGGTAKSGSGGGAALLPALGIGKSGSGGGLFRPGACGPRRGQRAWVGACDGVVGGTLAGACGAFVASRPCACAFGSALASALGVALGTAELAPLVSVAALADEAAAAASAWSRCSAA